MTWPMTEAATEGGVRVHDDMNAPVPSIGVRELFDALGSGAPLIDVREPHEYEDVHIGSAVLVPLGTVTESLDAFPSDRTVFVVCHLGGRSARAVEWLRQQGIDAVNVHGGTQAWVDAGLPTVSTSEPGAAPGPSGAP